MHFVQSKRLFLAVFYVWLTVIQGDFTRGFITQWYAFRYSSPVMYSPPSIKARMCIVK